jgi:hypothetical protein
MVKMKIENLLPFNGKTIQTKKMKNLGFSSKDINKLLATNNLKRTRRGYYLVELQYEIDYKLIKYYLLNNYTEEFYEYFKSLKIKDYKVYYYKFMCDISSKKYGEAYESLVKCCELNFNHENKIMLYSFVLLIEELLNVTPDKIEKLKNMIFDEDDCESIFLETLLKKDYQNVCKKLCSVKKKNKVSDYELNVLRNLSIQVKKVYSKKSKKNSSEYTMLVNNLHTSIIDNNFERAYHYFSKIKNLNDEYILDDRLVLIVNDLFKCFNYIVEHPNLDLTNYQTGYEYSGNLLNKFFTALNKNDYINAFEFCKLILGDSENIEFSIYYGLLERIYNFLNVRLIIKGKNPFKQVSPLGKLIKNKRYSEALEITKNDKLMDKNDKNIIRPLLETLVDMEKI